jgi:hypothetical protein
VIRLSDDRVSHLARLILEGLRKHGVADFPAEARALITTKEVLREFFHNEDQVDEIVRQKIQSLSRHVPLGSREWDILYRKYFEEESRKHRK